MMEKVLLMMNLAAVMNFGTGETGTEAGNYIAQEQYDANGYEMILGTGVRDNKLQFSKENVIGEEIKIGDAFRAVWNDKYLNEDEFFVYKLN